MHNCRYGKPAPATNKKFWAEKRRSNAERDVKNRERLEADGWRVFEIWECEIREIETLQARLEEVIEYLTRPR